MSGNAPWKKYGGVNKLDNFNNMSVHSFSTDLFTLRKAYYGAFDVCGELHASGDITSDSTIHGNNLIIENDIHANRLFVQVYTLEYSSVDISGTLHVTYGNAYLGQNLDVSGLMYLQNQLYLGNSGNAFLFAPSSGNIGVNTNTPLAAFDISSANPFAFNVGTATQPNVRAIPLQNMNGQGLVMMANDTSSQLGFYVDASINQMANAPDGLIAYSRGGYLTIDVSNNTNILSQVGISNRGNAAHILNEAVIIYDISSGPFLNLVYGNTGSVTGEALTLVANDASSIAFMNMITPNNRGIAFGGGVYPADTKRAMGSIGCLDASANYTPAINIVAGNSKVQKKATIGINTHAPKTESYAFDVNGPIRVRNSELTITAQTNFEILSLAVGKTATNCAIAIGTPTTVSKPYKQVFLYTNNRGEFWNVRTDLSGTGFEDGSLNSLRTSYVYDSSLTIFAGDRGFASYSYSGGLGWPSIDLPNQSDSISSVYIFGATPEVVRVFLAYDTNPPSIYWFDMSYSTINDSDGIISTSIADGGFSANVTVPITAMDGAGNQVWIISGSKILTFSATDMGNTNVTVANTHNGSYAYRTIYALDTNNIVAGGEGIISYTHDGTSWNNVTVNYAVNSIAPLDASNAIAVCDAGVILYTKDGYNTWNVVPAELLNGAGNANTVIDPSYNLKTVRVIDVNNFYITKAVNTYSLSGGSGSKGASSLFNVYLPGLFNSSNNFVLDISGGARISGDMRINDGGKLSSNNPTFSLLNEVVSQIQFGSDASSVFIGGIKANSNVIVNRDLRVKNDALIDRNLTVSQNTSIQNTLYVNSDASFNTNVFVAKNANIFGTLQVVGNALMSYEFAVSGNATVNQDTLLQGVLTVVGNATMNSNLTVVQDTLLQGVLTVVGNATMNSNLTVVQDTLLQNVLTVGGNAIMSSDLFALNDANISKKVFIGDTLYVVGRATMASNLQALNANIGNTLTVTGTTTLVSDLRALANVNLSRNLNVNGITTLSSDLRALSNANISKTLGIGGEVYGFGNITTLKSVYAQNTVYATNYDGLPRINAGVLNADFTMGLDMPELETREIKIGNFDVTGTVNTIYIGGTNDKTIFSKINTVNDINAGPRVHLNTPIFENEILFGNNSSVGSGLIFAEGGVDNVGYITVPADKTGFIFRPTNPTNTNVLKFDIENSVLPTSYTTGLMSLQRSDNFDSSYSTIVSAIDPSNIILGNKYLIGDDPTLQVIDTNFSVLGHVSIGSNPTTTNCAIEVNGDIFQSNGLIW